MKHISESELLDYAAGKLPGSESEQVRRHIAECVDCEKRHKQTLATWELLGTWRVDPSAHQVADRVESLARQQEAHGRSELKASIPLRRSLLPALRIAAAVLIAIGGGHLLGRLTAPSNGPTPVISTEKPRYLAALGFEWSSELTWTVLQEDTQSGANQP